MTDHAALHTELLGVVENAITNHPRSLQTRIGPSELGQPCARKIAYKLAGAPETNGGRVPWKPTIGTALHTWLEETFHNANDPDGDQRYLVETRVDVGEILGEDITGSCDLFHVPSGTVIDFKCIGDDQLRKYKTGGPGPQYRAQAHLYGRGWVRRGHPVSTVAVWFLPRNQELRQNHLWTEPYNEQIAIDALTRVEGIATLVGALGTAAAGMLPTADDWCRFCPYHRPGSTDPATGCPGDAGANQTATTAASRSLTDLIAR